MGGRQAGGRTTEDKTSFGDDYVKPDFLLYYFPDISNKPHFNLKQQFTVKFIYHNTMHCDHNAINLHFK